ncbi:MAG: NADH-quinone oxidoreductase subunit NuoE [Pseudomonadota bacterium]|nr:NADH-quinone oxidoreductase subunit NuoE [Pseudomonadota bacterium]
MLSAEERQAIAAATAHYPDARAASVEALKIVQARHGWVSDQHLREAADVLGMTAEELDAVATFYSLIYRRPVGRHVILLCDSVSCWIMGYDKVRERLHETLGIGLGETTPDGRFTLLPVCCLGACDRAPALLIGEDLHQNLDAERIDSILERYP